MHNLGVEAPGLIWLLSIPSCVPPREMEVQLTINSEITAIEV